MRILPASAFTTQCVIELPTSFDDPYPYLRCRIAEIGLPYKKLSYDPPARKRGTTDNSF